MPFYHLLTVSYIFMHEQEYNDTIRSINGIVSEISALVSFYISGDGQHAFYLFRSLWIQVLCRHKLLRHNFMAKAQWWRSLTHAARNSLWITGSVKLEHEDQFTGLKVKINLLDSLWCWKYQTFESGIWRTKMSVETSSLGIFFLKNYICYLQSQSNQTLNSMKVSVPCFRFLLHCFISRPPD